MLLNAVVKRTMKAEIKLYCYEDGVIETRFVNGDSLDEIREAADEACEDWTRNGEWGTDGASVSVKWTIVALEEFDEDADLSGALYADVEVQIEPDHAGKIQDAANGAEICGTDPDDHDWTREGEGGLTENPGVWSTGGTSFTFDAHCRKCGLHRCEYVTGSQKNPDEHDTVEYRMLDEIEIAQHRENGTMDEVPTD